MAVTAAMTVSSATAKHGQKVTCTCTVTNSGTPSLNVTAITPVVCPTGALDRHVAGAVGRPPLLPNQPVDVPGSSGTRAFSWDVILHAPTATRTDDPAQPSSLVYDVGATVTTSDGSITTATTTTITVTPAAY